MSVPKASPPSEFIRDEAEARDWSIDDLAQAIGFPTSWTVDLWNGSIRITSTVAERLGRAFGTSGAMWINLQKQYDKENES